LIRDDKRVNEKKEEDSETSVRNFDIHLTEKQRKKKNKMFTIVFIAKL